MTESVWLIADFFWTLRRLRLRAPYRTAPETYVYHRFVERYS